MSTVRFRDSQFDYVLGRTLHTGLLLLSAPEHEPYHLVRSADAAPLLARIRWTASQTRALETLLLRPATIASTGSRCWSPSSTRRWPAIRC